MAKDFVSIKLIKMIDTYVGDAGQGRAARNMKGGDGTCSIVPHGSTTTTEMFCATLGDFSSGSSGRVRGQET